MDEQEQVRRLIARLVNDAGLQRAQEREALRRELASHFEAAGESPEALRNALDRFGDLDQVGLGLQRAHRRGWRAWYTAKVGISILAAAGIAFICQLVGQLWLAGHLHFSTRDAFTAAISVVIGAVVVAAWEFRLEAIATRLERRPILLLATSLLTACGVYLVHQVIPHAVEPAQALVFGALLVITWTANVALLSRIEQAFVRFTHSR